MEKVKTLDKFLHTWIEFIIVSCISSVFYYVFKEAPVKSAFIGYITALIIGVLKELYDKFVKKTIFNKFDLLADFIGATGGFAFSLLLLCNTNN